jgi:hypothetical protein
MHRILLSLFTYTISCKFIQSLKGLDGGWPQRDQPTEMTRAFLKVILELTKCSRESDLFAPLFDAKVGVFRL